MRGRADGEPLLEHALLLAKALDRACGEVGTIGWGELVHQLRVASPLVCRLRADGNAGSLRRPRTLSSNGFGLRSGAEGLDLQLAGLQLELGVHAMQSRVDD